MTATITATRPRPQPLPRAITEPRRPRRLPRINPELLFATSLSLICCTVLDLGIGRYPAVGGDEGIYTEQAWAILHGSITPYTYTYDHPFVGWVQLAPLAALAEWLHIGGSLTVVDVRAVMAIYAFATLLLTYGIARRLAVSVPYAALAVLLLGLSPLYVVDARQVFLDNIAVPWVLAACYVALSPRRRMSGYALSAACFSVGVLSKETVVLFLPAVAYLAWKNAYRPTRAMCATTFVTVGTLIVSIYPLFAVLRNELFPGKGHVSLWTNGIAYQLATRKGSGAIWQAGSERRTLLDDWLNTDHVLLLAGVGAALLCLAVARVRAVGLAVLLWALPVIKPGGYLPTMYVIAALPFCALAVAGALDAVHARLIGTLGSRRPTLIATGFALGVAVLVAPHYFVGDRAATSSTAAVSALTNARQYVLAHVPRSDNVLTDDGLWTDLVRAGYGEPWHGAISYYKFDLDPATSAVKLPQGWKDIDFVVETDEMRDNLSALSLPRLTATLAHSTVVASWGTGTELVEVRKVEATPYNHTGATS